MIQVYVFVCVCICGGRGSEGGYFTAEEMLDNQAFK